MTSVSASTSASARSTAAGAGADRSGGAQTALLVLGRVRMQLRFFDVFDGDQADAAIGVVDHQQLLDAVRVQQALGFGLVDGFTVHGDQLVLGLQFADRLIGIGGEAHVAIGENADQASACFDHRNARDAVARHQMQRVAQFCVGRNGDRVHHHAGFEPLHAAHFFGLPFDRQVAMNDAETAGLRHRDGERSFGNRVHRGRDERDAQLDAVGQPRSGIACAGRMDDAAGTSRHVVECQRVANDRRGHLGRPIGIGQRNRAIGHGCGGNIRPMQGAATRLHRVPATRMARAPWVDFTPGEVYNPAVASSGVCSAPQSRRIVEIVLQSIKMTTWSLFCAGVSYGRYLILSASKCC